MTHTTLHDVLREYREGLGEALGEALDSVILYGSRARGESGDRSDIDVLCVMRGPVDYADLIARTPEITAAPSLKHDVVLSRVFVSQEDFNTRQWPFLMNVRKEGVRV